MENEIIKTTMQKYNQEVLENPGDFDEIDPSRESAALQVEHLLELLDKQTL